jgi:hypothetical protein
MSADARETIRRCREGHRPCHYYIRKSVSALQELRLWSMRHGYGAACNLARQRFDEVRASLNMLLWVLEQSTPHVRKAFRAEA